MSTPRRRHLVRRLTCALLVVITVLAPSIASAFCRMRSCKGRGCDVDADQCPRGGVPLRYPELPIIFRFRSQSSRQLVREEARAAIREAFHRWSDVLCQDGRRTSLRFQEGEDIDDDKPLATGARGTEPFGIYFRDFGWPHDTPDETLALTTHFFSETTGLINYTDMEINTATKRYSTIDAGEGIDLQAVVTHEAGHYIGLAHSRENLSIMAASYCETDDRCEKGRVAARRLGPDDIDAVCTLYPPEGLPPIEPTKGGCTVNAQSPSSPSRLALFSLMVVVVAAMASRVRARRSE